MEILRYIREIHAEGTTVIVASHDKIVVDTLGVRVIRLENGRVVRDSVGGYDASHNVSGASAPEKVEVAKGGSGRSQTSKAPPSSGKIKPIAI